MSKNTHGKTGIPPLMIIIFVTMGAFFLYFALSYAVEQHLGLQYVSGSQEGVYAVSGCTKLTQELSIPATYRGKPVGEIRRECFSNTDIRVLKLRAVTDIGDLAFRNCGKLEEIQLGKTRVIGENAFEFCRSLKTVTLPETVTQIGKRAFSFCEGLEAVYFLSDPEVLGENIFDFCPKAVIYGTPGGTVEAYCKEYGLTFCPIE